jgi:hypothetical protein
MRIPNSGVLTLTETPLAFDADQGASAASTKALREAASKNLRFIIDLQGVTGDSTTRHRAQPTPVRFKV